MLHCVEPLYISFKSSAVNAEMCQEILSIHIFLCVCICMHVSVFVWEEVTEGRVNTEIQ